MLASPRIVLDALAARFGGTAYAVVQLVRALTRDPRAGEVVVVTRHGSIVDRGLSSTAGVQLLRLPALRRSELLHRVGWEALRLPAVIRAYGADGLLTFSGMLPVHPDCRVVSYISNPVPFENGRGVASAVRRIAIARTAHRALAVYVPTRHFARLVSDLPRVRVVPWGVDRDSFRPAERPGSEILCVSDFYRHKRHDLLLDAYERLPLERPPLRLVGNPAVDTNWFRSIEARSARMPGVIVAGRVSFESLLAAYRKARVFVMPSEHEAFSMPLSESLCCGVPAIARDHPVLRETGGAGAWYVRDDDPGAWADALQLLLTDDDRHAELRNAGLREADRFSWPGVAARLMDDLAGEP
jgi:glycosyltransferase involved in cell wall biosynthesis